MAPGQPLTSPEFSVGNDLHFYSFPRASIHTFISVGLARALLPVRFLEEPTCRPRWYSTGQVPGGQVWPWGGRGQADRAVRVTHKPDIYLTVGILYIPPRERAGKGRRERETERESGCQLPGHRRDPSPSAGVKQRACIHHRQQHLDGLWGPSVIKLTQICRRKQGRHHKTSITNLDHLRG